MKNIRKKNRMRRNRQRGFSLIELLVVLFVVMVVAGLAVPNVLLAVSNIRLRASAADLAGLMQLARITAAKNNATYQILYATQNGARIAYIDLNGNGSFDAEEPMVQFSGTTVPASGAPSGNGQASVYTLAGDTGTGSHDNTNTLGYAGGRIRMGSGGGNQRWPHQNRDVERQHMELTKKSKRAKPARDVVD